EGQEKDDFTTMMGGASLSYVPENRENPLYMKFLASTYQSDENERIDIIGDYTLGQINSDLGSEDYGEIVAVLGQGIQHQFVRNYLTSNVTNVEFKGGLEISKKKEEIFNLTEDEEEGEDEEEVSTSHFLQWGIKYQNEIINDKLNEWERLDSAGYSLPFSESDVFLQYVLKTENNLNSNRFSAYFQDSYLYEKDSFSMKVSYGVRASYWSMNKEFVYSPRVQMLLKPRTKEDISFRFATGMYNQPPFYREMRRLDGTVNRDLKAQKSIHAVAGYNWDFKWGDIPFRFTSEIYYKHLWDLVSYDLDNVRIRYSGENNATGYVTGIDLRLNGEFVPGEESWVNLSFLRARESFNDVQHYQFEVGSVDSVLVNTVARPTDQFMSLSMFFQDHLPKQKSLKMHLNLTVGTGWPFGVPNNNVGPRNTYRFSPYHRVDIGFSAKLWNEEWLERRPKHPLRFTKHTWLSLEVFNLLQVSNQASNTWIRITTGRQYAVPNYLTSRRINLRLRMEF
ncbi:MAG: TonB-dependent receptor, partial [Saprospiraceae bacterium]